MYAILPLLITSPAAYAALVVERTDVEVDIAGPVAELTIRQRFVNTNEDFAEATYLFPLGEDAAVDDMAMRFGDREIRAEIHPRAEAREIYEAAKEAGQTAALTEQERPNVFTQSVANLPPGEAVEVLLHVVQPLEYEDGVYSFALPLVVGPRFTVAGEGAGETPDAARLAAPASPAPITHRVDVQVYAELGLELARVESPSHPDGWVDLHPGGAEVSLEGARLDRDFVLELEPRGDAPQVAALVQDGHVGLLFEPQAEPAEVDLVPRELIFVVDNSCSMSGAPMNAAKAAMRRALEGLHPDDSFQVMRFSEEVSGLSPVPLAATRANVERGLDFVDAMEGMGPTEMLAGVEAALAFPSDPARERILCFLTDGYIGNEREILASISDGLGDARLFSFGVGAGVNRYLLERMAEVGRGDVTYMLPDQDPAEAADTFYRRIAQPVLTDIEIDWGADADAVYPSPLPDLFAGQSLSVWAKVDGPLDTIVVRGRIGGGDFEQIVEVEPVEDGAIPSAWARARLRSLAAEQLWGEVDDVREEMTELALRYRLMSEYTSFVAVEYQITNPDGAPPLSLAQDLELPSGVIYEAVGGSELSRRAMRPGDPLLTVYAPEDTQVIAVFPWGEVAPMRWDLDRDRWYHRFLVPREVADGDVEIQIFVHHADGRIEVRAEPLRIDALAPELDLEAEQREAGVLVRLYPEEPLRSLHVYPVGRPEARLRIDLRAPEFADEDVIEIVVPGRHEELVVVAKDLALNRVQQIVEVVQ